MKKMMQERKEVLLKKIRFYKMFGNGRPNPERESTSERVRISCQCKGDCTSKRCRCYKEGLHTDDYRCQNLSNLSERTQVGLKDNRTRKRQHGDTIGDAIVVERSR